MNKFLFFGFFLIGINQNLFCQFLPNSFMPKVDFATSNSTQGMAVADMNMDGKLDVLSANIAGSSVGIHINNSSFGIINSSSFPLNVTLSTLSNQPQQIFPKDVNNDGKIDLIIGYSIGSAFTVFLNNYSIGTISSSNFTRIDITTGSTPAGIVAVDLDKNGTQDIVTANYASNNIAIFKNNSSTSTSLSLSSPTNLSTGSGPNSIAAGDIDADGKTDLVVTNWTSGTITVFRNTTVGTNISFTSSSHSTQVNPYWSRIVNLDNDSTLEVVCSNFSSASVSVFDNTATSGISFAPRLDLSMGTGANTQASTINDFNGDDKMDIAAVANAFSTISIFKNQYTNGAINSTSFSTLLNIGVGSNPVGSTSGDIDGDMRPELIVANYSTNTFSVIKNKNLAPEPSIPSTVIGSTVIGNQLVLNLTKGNGSKRMVVVRVVTSSSVLPSDTLWYSSNDTFGLGQNLGSGNFIVYSDTGSVITVNGLSVGQEYAFTIIEYNGRGGFSNYLLSNYTTFNKIIPLTYYSKSSGNLNDTASWGKNLDGTGVGPSNFGEPNTVYIVKNNPSPTIGANWVITGTSSYLSIGDGISPLNFTIPLGKTVFVDSISIRSGTTFTHIGNIIYNKTFYEDNSTCQVISSSMQNIPGSSFYNLVIVGGTKLAQNNIEVRNTLSMLTSINMGSYQLTLGTSTNQIGTLNINSGYIIGKFARWFAPTTNSGVSGYFPISNGTIFKPLTIEFTTAPSIGGYLVVDFQSTNPGNSGLPIYDFSTSPLVEINKASINGYWRVVPSGTLTGGAYKITLTGTSISGVSSVSDLRIVKRLTNGAWTIQGTAIAGTGTNGAPIVSRSGMAGFGEFTIAGDSNINSLPVTYLNFDGIKNGERNELKWSTSSEINNKVFIVERKLGSESEFIPIGNVLPQKQSGVKNYLFYDFINDNLSYVYRINQIDFDGINHYSREIIIEPSGFNEEIVIFPNPSFGEYIFIKGDDLPSFIHLYNSNGQGVKREVKDGVINVKGLQSGLYILKYTHRGLSKAIKVQIE